MSLEAATGIVGFCWWHERHRPRSIASLVKGRTLRITKLIALAIRFDELILSGLVRNFNELAELGQVSRAKITQIMNLLLLAPEIQERLLFLPRVEKGEDPLHLKDLQRSREGGQVEEADARKLQSQNHLAITIATANELLSLGHVHE